MKKYTHAWLSFMAIKRLEETNLSRTNRKYADSLIEWFKRHRDGVAQGAWYPDFFIKVANDIIVVEIKMDNDVSDENKAKLRYSKEHFARVNELQKEQRYYFKFLSPESYDLFFKALREKTYTDFRSELEAKLEES